MINTDVYLLKKNESKTKLQMNVKFHMECPSTESKRLVITWLTSDIFKCQRERKNRFKIIGVMNYVIIDLCATNLKGLVE